MSDDNDGGIPPKADGGQVADIETRFKNLQSEINRKLENTNQALAQQNQQMKVQLEGILGAVTKQKQPSKESNINLKDMIYDDPDRFVATIEERAVNRASEMISQNTIRNNESQTVLMQLTNDYPELRDQSSELYQKSIAAYANISERFKNTPEGYRVAIREAAAELGVIPLSKRSTGSSDDFALPGSTSGSEGRPKSQSQQKIDPKTLEFARLLGRDTSDPKVLKRLEKTSQRNKWSKFE